ncbi:MAG: polyhydroxyalkanoate synthesis repressor PhaR, partial [Beijerinckiaceae bacterium]
MTKAKTPTVIKKYANRRLYHTGTSTYVTLDDLAQMVKKGEEFTVSDAKSGEDLTRTVLTQIIFELEGKEGQQTMLPVNFLRQLIGFYGHQMEGLVPSYLEHSMQQFAKEQQKFREHMSRAMSGDVIGVMQEQARANMTVFQDAFRLFNPFTAQQKAAEAAAAPEDVEAMKRDLDAMRSRLDKLNR